MKHVHFIGIGGSGLSAIAMILLERGYRVSGSDRQFSPLAQRLQQAGASVYTGHSPENVAGADLVVRSSAVPDDNVEVQAARTAGIPVLKRVDFLGQLKDGQQFIAVAGTHGKTTTTAMLAWVLTALGQDPSYIIGGVSTNLGRNAHAGGGRYFVIEADEYDHMFLGLYPLVAVVTNIEHDHPDCYPTYQDFYQAFQEFAGHISPAGALVACGEDLGAATLLAWAAQAGFQTVSYGLGDAGYDCCAVEIASNQQGGFSFTMADRDNQILASVALQEPGLHNVANALSVLAVVRQLGLPVSQAAAALGEYRGTGRRFEVRDDVAGITVIDDYAHHPTQIRAILAAARVRYPGRRVWAVWQPHTFSRTRTLFVDFAAAFSEADRVIVTEIYAAREASPADGFSSRQLVEAMRHHRGLRNNVHFSPDLSDARDYLLEGLRSGDVVLVLSAGDADQMSAQLIERLQKSYSGSAGE